MDEKSAGFDGGIVVRLDIPDIVKPVEPAAFGKAADAAAFRQSCIAETVDVLKIPLKMVVCQKGFYVSAMAIADNIQGPSIRAELTERVLQPFIQYASMLFQILVFLFHAFLHDLIAK